MANKLVQMKNGGDNLFPARGFVALWANSNPNAAFAGQTITLNDDLSKFKAIDIIHKEYSTYYRVERIYIDAFVNSYLHGTTTLGVSGEYILNRSVAKVSNNQISFGDCGYQRIDMTGRGFQNLWAVPVSIIGII